MEIFLEKKPEDDLPSESPASPPVADRSAQLAAFVARTFPSAKKQRKKTVHAKGKNGGRTSLGLAAAHKRKDMAKKGLVLPPLPGGKAFSIPLPPPAPISRQPPDPLHRRRPRSVDEWQDMLVSEGISSIEKLVALRDGAYSEKVQLDAARDLLDRAAYDMRKSSPKSVSIFTNVSTDELVAQLARYEALEKALPASASPSSPGPAGDAGGEVPAPSA